MARLRLKTLWRTGGWLALGFVLLLIVEILATGSFDDAYSILALPVLVGWIATPVVGAAGFVGASSTRLGASAFLIVEFLFVASTVWIVFHQFYLHPGALAGVVFFPWPVAQLFALGAVFLVALLFGWRMRPDFLKG